MKYPQNCPKCKHGHIASTQKGYKCLNCRLKWDAEDDADLREAYKRLSDGQKPEPYEKENTDAHG